MDKSKMSLTEQAKEILRIAEKHGVAQNFFFVTTFKRYQVQIGILSELEQAIKTGGALEKSKTNPAISEYNKTCTAANQTVTSLMKIITSIRGFR